MTHPYTITRRELTPEMLAANDPPSIEVRRALWAALLSASDKPGSVLTDEDIEAIMSTHWATGVNVPSARIALARAVEAAILEKLK